MAMEALLLRTGLVLVGWAAIDAYDALIRAGDRDVLSIWPVDPRSVVRFELRRLVSRRAWLVLAAAALLSPIAAVDPVLWGLGVLHSAAVLALAIPASALGLLLAVGVAEHPSAAPWLDLVRGNNHPAQAAFLYAPGAVLLATGGFVQAAAMGVGWLHGGSWVGAVLLGSPVAVAAACVLPIPALARRSWFRAGTVTNEIDARYALLEDRSDALRVYLEWAVRFLPVDAARWALKDLRHGWRARRTWISAAWLVGLASVVAAWTRDPTGPGRAAAIAVLGCWVVASVGVLLERDEPEFLAAWLPPGGPARSAGRAFALVGWLQPAIWPGALAAGARQGVGAFGLVLAAGLLTAAASAAAAMFCGRRGGLALYGPIAAFGAALVALGVLR